jgi:hypothetical protein
VILTQRNFDSLLSALPSNQDEHRDPLHFATLLVRDLLHFPSIMMISSLIFSSLNTDERLQGVTDNFTLEAVHSAEEKVDHIVHEALKNTGKI